jgi:hypothetical protein
MVHKVGVVNNNNKTSGGNAAVGTKNPLQGGRKQGASGSG